MNHRVIDCIFRGFHRCFTSLREERGLNKPEVGGNQIHSPRPLQRHHIARPLVARLRHHVNPEVSRRSRCGLRLRRKHPPELLHHARHPQRRSHPLRAILPRALTRTAKLISPEFQKAIAPQRVYGFFSTSCHHFVNRLLVEDGDAEFLRLVAFRAAAFAGEDIVCFCGN